MCVLSATMLSRPHTWGDTMTAEDLETTFKQYKGKLMQYVKRRYRIRQDEEDIVMDAFVSAFAGKEYKKVPVERARTWWYYKVRGRASTAVTKAVEEMKGSLQYQQDPTTMEQWHEDLSESEGLEVLEEYWKELPRYTQCRVRQRWEEGGKEWLPFMYPKE